MKKIFLGVLIGVMVLSLSGVVGAGKLIPAADKAKEKAKADNSPVIEKAAGGHLSLSTPGLEKVVLIHYKKGFAKPVTDCGNGVCEPGENINKCPADCGGVEEPPTACSAFLGAKWPNTPVNYVIDPDNQDGLSQAFVVDAMVSGAEEWDNHTSAELFGSYTIDYNSSWDNIAPDGRNELLFGNYPEDGVIGVTVIWGYFKGKPSKRGIVEFDILFDTDFSWEYSSTSVSMDLQNIATHELGHGIGLADLYDTACSEETMYGYSQYGETKKRTLSTGDILGIQQLYGF